MLRRLACIVTTAILAVIGLGIGTASAAPASSCEHLQDARQHMEDHDVTPPDGFISVFLDHCAA